MGDPATGTITDDDSGSDDGATVTIADASAAEGDSLTFTVTLHRAVAGGLTVTPSFTDDTAAEGADYTANTAALSFSGTVGEQHTVTVATLEDAVVEDDERFTVSLGVSDAPSGVTVGDPATGTITDDDGGSVDNATVTIADASAAEGDSLAFTVTLHKAVEGGLTVTPDFSDGTAAEGADYTANTDGAQLQRHGRRAAHRHGGDPRRCGRRGRRALHGESGRVGRTVGGNGG